MPKVPKRMAVSSGKLPGALPDTHLTGLLDSYKASHGLNSKGRIATMIFASRLARGSGIPFDIERGITTEGEGQVKGLGKGPVQAILRDYGITKVLAEEAGRTSRGSLGNIRSYLSFLNGLAPLTGETLASIEAWWVEQAKRFFNAKPFALRFVASQSIRSVIRDLLAQAKKRQDEAGGTMLVGAMLQHLVGAKLELALPKANIQHNGFSVADAAGGRAGDFDIGSAAIHVTTSPGEAVIRKCASNLAAGKQPLIITVADMLLIADYLADQAGIGHQLDILDAEQFIVANLHELGGFHGDRRRVTVESLIDKYNAIVDANESDPSLKISRG